MYSIDILFSSCQYADQQRHVDALNAWRNATVLKPDHSLAWNNMVILLDNIGIQYKLVRTYMHAHTQLICLKCD